MSEKYSGFTEILTHPDFIVVNKMAGVDMHDDMGVPGLVSRVSAAIGQDVYPVHRLDKVTSGVVLLAKNTEATRLLSLSFAERKVKKIYLAISDRTPKKKQGWIKGDMAKGRNGCWRLLHSLDNPAVTYFQSLSLKIPKHRLYIIFPHTGKTHQIRVAMKSISAPILGDERYGGTPAERTYLHAWRLQFPYSGADYSVEAPHRWGEKIDSDVDLQNFIP
ncbi:TIGR01621 family pseudouridine synthase [Tolumonas lignilytica]|uniref:TIGR01621 family pseudouridine synthase n=1 Tax=Tolumonas lignilytica TaxID=1283284 RepID=UPI0004B455C5|nr:TIGR01621 family pseudouridine synthase [Tolumonas lignilytica]